MQIGLAHLSQELIHYLETEGFYWSTEHGCYTMETERFRKWNNKPMANNPRSFETTSHTTSAPFGGDCGKPWSEIMRNTTLARTKKTTNGH